MFISALHACYLLNIHHNISVWVVHCLVIVNWSLRGPGTRINLVLTNHSHKNLHAPAKACCCRHGNCIIIYCLWSHPSHTHTHHVWFNLFCFLVLWLHQTSLNTQRLQDITTHLMTWWCSYISPTMAVGGGDYVQMSHFCSNWPFCLFNRK